MLAPVAVEIDLNLQRLRKRTAEEVEYRLELELDRDGRNVDRGDRETLVVRQATRDVDLHGWTAAITDDGVRLHLDGGSVSLDLGLSEGISSYIEDGVGLAGQGSEAR
jgi:hypothetical protein